MTMQEGLFIGSDGQKATIQTQAGNTAFWIPRAEYDKNGVIAAIAGFPPHTFVQFEATAPAPGKGNTWRLVKIWATQGAANVPQQPAAPYAPQQPPAVAMPAPVAQYVPPIGLAPPAAQPRAAVPPAAPQGPQPIPSDDQKAMDMFVMGVVGRAMGSGKFDPSHIEALTFAAVDAWRAWKTPTAKHHPPSMDSQYGPPPLNEPPPVGGPDDYGAAPDPANPLQ